MNEEPHPAVRVLARAARTHQGVSQPDMAEDLDVDRNTIQGWEYGGFMPNTPHLLRLIELAPPDARKEFIAAIPYRKVRPKAFLHTPAPDLEPVAP